MLCKASSLRTLPILQSNFFARLSIQEGRRAVEEDQLIVRVLAFQRTESAPESYLV